MDRAFRNIIIALLVTVFLPNQIKAQEYSEMTMQEWEKQTKVSEKSQYIDISIGVGYSFPYDNQDISGSGFYAQGEYVFNLSKWIGLRPYMGLITTSTKKDSEDSQVLPDYKVTSNAFLVGGKARLTFPIPWVAPYFELGAGASVGSFVTKTASTDLKKSGVLYHTPFSVGLSIGKKTKVDIEYTYYYHGAVKQFSGVAAIGIGIPIE